MITANNTIEAIAKTAMNEATLEELTPITNLYVDSTCKALIDSVKTQRVEEATEKPAKQRIEDPTLIEEGLLGSASIRTTKTCYAKDLKILL